MDPYLNKVHEEQAYHCGRLLAVLAFAQECALKSVNSGVIRRMLGSVMASPGLQLGRLQRAAEVGHIPKLKKHLAAFVRDELKFINSALGNDVPLILQARQQGIFMLGFYQQMLFLEFTGTQVRDQRLLRTRQGEWVRSKGEVRLANLLTKRGIRYIYEPVATLASGPERYPDFVVWGTHPNETIYIEYLGMNTLEYNSRWQRKLQAYHESGITESGGPEGRLVVIDAREKELDDLAMLNILEPVFGAAPKHKGTKE